MTRAKPQPQPPPPEPEQEPVDETAQGWQRWRPWVGTWAGRLGLIGLGFVLGAELGRTWGPVAVGVFALVVAAFGTVAGLINVDREIAPQVTLRNGRDAGARADALLRTAGERSIEVRRAAELEAEETLTAAKLEARLIVERARTAATALDSAAHRRPRAKPDDAP